jgi:hypothetical protein
VSLDIWLRCHPLEQVAGSRGLMKTQRVVV